MYNNLKGQHILTTKVFNNEMLKDLFDLANVLKPIANSEYKTNILDGAVLSSLFFEPSTRTRLSFDSAFLKLGGKVSNMIGMDNSSMAKGESIYDTARVIAGYSDIIVVRHPTNGTVDEFASNINIPVINGGCGSEEHPTQSLLDMYTLHNELRRIDKKLEHSTILFIGDLKYGRTIHSLVHLLSLTKGINYIFIAPDSLKLPEYYLKVIEQSANSIKIYNSIQDIKENVDVIYSTRIQQERLAENEIININSSDFRITKSFVDSINVKCLMHPLPRNSRDISCDISIDLNGDDRLAIFRQTDNGLLIRMALFCKILGVDEDIEKTFKETGWFRPKYIGKDDIR